MPSTLLVIFAARLRGGEDFVEALVARGGVLVPQAHLGVVDDRRQHVVELVRRRADQLAQGRQPLRLAQLCFEQVPAGVRCEIRCLTCCP